MTNVYCCLGSSYLEFLSNILTLKWLKITVVCDIIYWVVYLFPTLSKPEKSIILFKMTTLFIRSPVALNSGEADDDWRKEVCVTFKHFLVLSESWQRLPCLLSCLCSAEGSILSALAKETSIVLWSAQCWSLLASRSLERFEGGSCVNASTTLIQHFSENTLIKVVQVDTCTDWSKYIKYISILESFKNFWLEASARYDITAEQQQQDSSSL